MRHRHNLGRLLGSIHRKGRNYFHREFTALELSGGIHSFLMVLYHRDGLCQNELSRILSFDKAHTTRAIQKLLDLGYITRERDDADHRKYRIHLTDKARSHEDTVKSVLHQWMDTITSGLTHEEIETLASLLEKMNQNAGKSLNGK